MVFPSFLSISWCEPVPCHPPTSSCLNHLQPTYCWESQEKYSIPLGFARIFSNQKPRKTSKKTSPEEGYLDRKAQKKQYYQKITYSPEVRKPKDNKPTVPNKATVPVSSLQCRSVRSHASFWPKKTMPGPNRTNPCWWRTSFPKWPKWSLAFLQILFFRQDDLMPWKIPYKGSG